MTRRHQVIRAFATAVLVAGALSGCLFDDEEEDCGSRSASLAAGCVDPTDPECVGTLPREGDEVRVDSSDVRLAHGLWVRSEGADFDSRPPRVDLALRGDTSDDNATATDLAIGQTLDAGEAGYRVAFFCDTGVTWLVPLTPR